MGAVHVVDRVGQLARDAEALRRTEAGAVLDIAVLLAVKPVHRGDPVRVLGDAGDDRGGADRRHRGERGDAVGDVAPALASAPVEPAPRRRRPRARASPGPSRRSRTGRAWAGVEPTASHQRRRMRSPAYFSPARARAAPEEPAEQDDRHVAERVKRARRARRAEARRRRGRGSAPRARRGRADGRERRRSPVRDARCASPTAAGRRAAPATRRRRERRACPRTAAPRPRIRGRPATPQADRRPRARLLGSSVGARPNSSCSTYASTSATTTIRSHQLDCRKRKGSPAKLTPRAPAEPSAPARSSGRNGRSPQATARPAPRPM